MLLSQLWVGCFTFCDAVLLCFFSLLCPKVEGTSFSDASVAAWTAKPPHSNPARASFAHCVAQRLQNRQEFRLCACVLERPSTVLQTSAQQCGTQDRTPQFVAADASPPDLILIYFLGHSVFSLLLPVASLLLLTVFCKLPTAYCLLQASYRPLFYRQLPTAIACCKVPIACCKFPTAYSLLQSLPPFTSLYRTFCCQATQVQALKHVWNASKTGKKPKRHIMLHPAASR